MWTIYIMYKQNLSMYSFQNLGHNIHRTWQKMSWLVLTTITMHCGHQKEHLVKLMRSHLIYLPLCLWELDLVSRTRKKEPSLAVRCYRRLPNISYKDHVTNQEVRSRVQDTVGVYGDLLTMVKKRMATSQILRHGEDDSAGDSEMRKKKRTTEEEMGRQHQRMDRNVVWRFPGDRGRQRKVER